MARLNRRPIAALIALDLLAMTLAGCGASPAAPTRLGARPAAAPAAGAPAAVAAAKAPAVAAAKPRVTVTAGPAPATAEEALMADAADPEAVPTSAAPVTMNPHAAPPAGLLDRDYDPAARYSAAGSDAAVAGAVKAQVGGGAIVGPIGINWGLIGGGIGAGLVGGSLIGYAIYTGLVGSKDLLFPADKEDLVKKPGAYGWPYENVTFEGHDGTELKGWYIPAEVPTKKAILLLHGHTSNKDRFVEKYGAWLHHDYNLFIYDSRFHGESGGTITTLGYHERKDAALALEEVKERCNEEIAVMGESMGGAVAIELAADKPEIKACWSDCAFDSLHDAIAPRAKNRKYPLPQYVAWSVVKTASIRAKANLAKYDPIDVVSQIAPRPLYLVHGEADDSTLPMNSEKLFAGEKMPKTFWRVGGAGHADSWKIAPAEYERRLTTFFGENL